MAFYHLNLPGAFSNMQICSEFSRKANLERKDQLLFRATGKDQVDDWLILGV